jgi:hypothetical protein
MNRMDKLKKLLVRIGYWIVLVAFAIYCGAIIGLWIASGK